MTDPHPWYPCLDGDTPVQPWEGTPSAGGCQAPTLVWIFAIWMNLRCAKYWSHHYIPKPLGFLPLSGMDRPRVVVILAMYWETTCTKPNEPAMRWNFFFRYLYCEVNVMYIPWDPPLVLSMPRLEGECTGRWGWLGRRHNCHPTMLTVKRLATCILQVFFCFRHNHRLDLLHIIYKCPDIIA